MTDINYIDSLTELMPIYYYFLDGYINPDISFSSKIHNFLIEYDISPNIENNIIFN
jgi:hypothetical protein